MITKIGDYKLYDSVEKHELTSVSRADEINGVKKHMGAQTKDLSVEEIVSISGVEEMFEGKPFSFLEVEWTPLIATVGRRIWKVSCYWQAANKKEADLVFKKVRIYFSSRCGENCKHPFMSQKYIWGATNLNLTIEKANYFVQHGIQLLLQGDRESLENQ